MASPKTMTMAQNLKLILYLNFSLINWQWDSERGERSRHHRCLSTAIADCSECTANKMRWITLPLNYLSGSGGRNSRREHLFRFYYFFLVSCSLAFVWTFWARHVWSIQTHLHAECTRELWGPEMPAEAMCAHHIIYELDYYVNLSNISISTSMHDGVFMFERGSERSHQNACVADCMRWNPTWDWTNNVLLLCGPEFYLLPASR